MKALTTADKERYRTPGTAENERAHILVEGLLRLAALDCVNSAHLESFVMWIQQRDPLHEEVEREVRARFGRPKRQRKAKATKKRDAKRKGT